eukprot:TRINITY_DN16738_c0_g1_i2.p2 TRINITY_DN16738_c0_g1~~TRINITY_DN16738_c0_g1_i2.p2  ORF type:complete len:118 (+),score=23.00 TRINITY_DN16738_c0_g1_i2:782-1135(+)
MKEKRFWGMHTKRLSNSIESLLRMIWKIKEKRKEFAEFCRKQNKEYEVMMMREVCKGDTQKIKKLCKYRSNILKDTKENMKERLYKLLADPKRAAAKFELQRLARSNAISCYKISKV